MGLWATQNLHRLSDAQLAEYDRILSAETADIFLYITNKATPPPELAGPVLDAIIAFVQAAPLGKGGEAARGYASAKGVFSN